MVYNLFKLPFLSKSGGINWYSPDLEPKPFEYISFTSVKTCSAARAHSCNLQCIVLY
jgi:hypothetical protein